MSKKKILSALMSLSILVGNAPVISAENTVSEKRIIFSDDFSKDKAWKKNTRGKMEISSGKLAFQKKFVDGIKSTITAENYNFQNGHIGFDVKLSEIKEFSVMFRMSNEHNNYRVRFERDKILLEKRVNGGNYIEIKSIYKKLSDNKNYRIDIGLLGSRITVDIDDENYIDCIDYGFTEGYIGFSAVLGNVFVDNLEIYEISTDEYVEKQVNENAVEIFVATDGNDETGNGTYEKPYKTIDKAKVAVRRMKALNRPINVVFKEGTYYFDEAAVFESIDSGDSFVPVTYKGEDGKEVRFSGAKTLDISKFEPVSDEKIKARLYEDVQDKVLQLDLAEQGFKREDLDVISGMKIGKMTTLLQSAKILLNNRPQPLAKWPNAGWEKIESCSNENFNGEFGKIFFDNAEPFRWLEAKDAFVEGNMFYEWYEEHIPIKKINTETMAIELARAGGYGLREDHEYRVINLLEEIDIPGEWYADYDTMMLYYYPQHELGEDDVLEVTTLEDSFIYLDKVSHLTFKNIIFENSKGPNDAYGWDQKSRKTGGGIDIGRESKNITIDGCTFKDIAGSGVKRITNVYAVDLKDVDCNLNIYIQNCNFYRCSYRGISLRAGDSARLKPAKIYIRNNFFHESFIELFNHSCCGIEITNNLINKTRLNALRTSGNEFKANNNEIVYGSYEGSDMGAIYCGRNVAAHNSTISRNLIIDYGPTGERSFPAGGIYLDDLIGGITLEQNMTRARSKDYYSTGIIYGGGPDIVYRGNVSVDANRAFTIQNRAGSSITYLGSATSGALQPFVDIVNRNFDNWIKKYPAVERFKDLYDDPYKYSAEILVEENLSTNAITPMLRSSMDLKPYLTGQIDDPYVVDDYSIYVDAENHDYRITKEAKEKYNLPDSLPCEDNLDIDSIGLQRELKYDEELIKFNITYPENGDTLKYSNDVDIAWEESDAGITYEYIVAKDKEFKDIAASGETTYCSVNLTELEENTKYYVKVIAKNMSRKAGYELENENGIIEFSTSSTSSQNTALLEQTIILLTNKLSELKIGDGKGDCSAEAIEEIKKKINDGKAVLKNSEITQSEIDELSNELIGYYNSIDSYRNVGYTGINLTDKTQWTLTSPVKSMYQREGRTDIVTDKGVNMTLQGEVPNTDVLCFRFKLTNIRGWNGIALKIKDGTKQMYSDNCYYVAIKDDVFELQRKGTILKTVPNNGLFKENTWYDIQFGCVTLKGGINIIFKLGDKVIFDYFDDSGEAEYKAGSFALNIRENVGVSIASPTNLPEGFFKPSQEIQETVEFGKQTSYSFVLDSFNKESGEWIVNDKYKNNSHSPAGEIVAKGKGASARWTITADGDTTYRVYYWHNPAEDHDSEVKITLAGKDGTYKTTVDMTKGEEGYVELGTFKFVSDNAKIGMLNVMFEGSGKGKLPLSSVKIQKVDKKLYPDMLVAEE